MSQSRKKKTSEKCSHNEINKMNSLHEKDLKGHVEENLLPCFHNTYSQEERKENQGDSETPGVAAHMGKKSEGGLSLEGLSPTGERCQGDEEATGKKCEILEAQ